MSSEEKRESEENAESDDECEREAEDSDPGTCKTRIRHFCVVE